MQILRKVCSTPDSAWDTVAGRASAPCFSRAGAAPNRARPFLASAAPSLSRLLALRMPMAGTPGETDQNRGPRPA
jgi:hypothetical protein